MASDVVALVLVGLRGWNTLCDRGVVPEKRDSHTSPLKNSISGRLFKTMKCKARES